MTKRRGRILITRRKTPSPWIQGWKQLFGAHTHFQNIFIDPIVSARKKVEKRDRHEEREREREREREKERDVSTSTPSSVIIWLMMALTPKRLFLSLSLFMSISLLRLFSRAHYWGLIYSPEHSWQIHMSFSLVNCRHGYISLQHTKPSHNTWWWNHATQSNTECNIKLIQ